MTVELLRLRALRTADLIDEVTYSEAVRGVLGLPQAIAAPPAQLPSGLELAAEDTLRTSERRLEKQISAWFGCRASPCFDGDAWAALMGNGNTETLRDRLKDLVCEERHLWRRLSILFLAAGEGATPTSLVGPANEVARLAAWEVVVEFAVVLTEEVALPGAPSSTRASFSKTIREVMSGSSTTAAKNTLLAGVSKHQTATEAAGMKASQKRPSADPVCGYCHKGTHPESACNAKAADRARRDDDDRRERRRREDEEDRRRRGSGPSRPLHPSSSSTTSSLPLCPKCKKRHTGKC